MQIYSLKCSSQELTTLTSSATNLTTFSATASGEVVVYTAKKPVSTFMTQSVKRNGIVVTSEDVTDLIRGSHGGGDDHYDDDSLSIIRSGKETETKIATQGRVSGVIHEMSLSPDGEHLLLQTEATNISSTWSEYEDQFLKVAMLHPPLSGGHTGILQYELVDTVTGTSQVLFDAPIPTLRSEIAWSPDSKSVLVSNVYLPLNIGDPAERALRKAHTFLVEFTIPSLQFVKVSQDDLRLLNWDPKTGDVICDVGRIDSLNGKTTPKAYFHKSGETWSKASSPEQKVVSALPYIILDEGMNTPPHILAVDPPTGRKALLMDLNSQLQNLALARVEEIAWNDAHGDQLRGGLYWPLDYIAGKKYPLVLQTHGWDSDRFWMDGPWTTAFAAQALAGKGFFVVQVPDPDWHILFNAEGSPKSHGSV